MNMSWKAKICICNMSFKPVLFALCVAILITFLMTRPGLWNAQHEASGSHDNQILMSALPIQGDMVRGSHLEESDTKPPPCGEVCLYGGRERKVGMDNYQEIIKDINCPNILGRMAWEKYEVVYPPLKNPPPELLQAYTQNGLMPLRKNRYYVDFSPNSTKPGLVYSNQMLTDLQNKEAKGGSICQYPIGRAFSNIVKENSHFIKGKTGFVIGTLKPWIEATLLNYAPKHITTFEYADLKLMHPKMSVSHPVTFAKKFLAGGIEPFDFGASFSSLEHSGLGRYGDPMNPYGDLEAMAQAWCLTKPGGLFILGLQCTNNMKDPAGFIEWNAHRFYGTARLAQITANWESIAKGTPTAGHRILVLKRL